MNTSFDGKPWNFTDEFLAANRVAELAWMMTGQAVWVFRVLVLIDARGGLVVKRADGLDASRLREWEERIGERPDASAFEENKGGAQWLQTLGTELMRVAGRNGLTVRVKLLLPRRQGHPGALLIAAHAENHDFGVVSADDWLESCAEVSRLRVQQAQQDWHELALDRALRLAGCARWTYAPDADQSQVSPWLADLIGLKPGVAITLADGLALIADPGRQAVQTAIERCVLHADPLLVECDVHTLEGLRRLRLSAQRERDPEGKALVVGIAQDVSESHASARMLDFNFEQLRAMSKRLVRIQEAERRRLATELHDRVGQNLTALGLSLEVVRRGLAALGQAGDPLEQRVNDAQQLVDESAGIVSSVLAELRPPMLDDFGLVAALEWFARKFEQRSSIVVQVRQSGLPMVRHAERDLGLFRIAQEALSNASKHSEALRVDIDVCQEPERLIMTIADDGRGFSNGDPLTAPGRLGMKAMRERALALRGELQVDSSKDRGCRLIIMVPT